MRKFKLSDKSSMFYDASTGVKILPGQEVEIPNYAMASAKIKNAIGGGHIKEVKASEPEVTVAIEKTPEELLENFKNLVSKGGDLETLVKKFKVETLKVIAEFLEIELEETDTKLTIAQTIIEVLEEESKEEE